MLTPSGPTLSLKNPGAFRSPITMRWCPTMVNMTTDEDYTTVALVVGDRRPIQSAVWAIDVEWLNG